MPQDGIWAWDGTNNNWVKIKTDDQGRLYTVAVIDELNDIGDVEVAAPADGEALVWDDGAGDWIAAAPTPAAHKDSHDPEDGADPLDTAAPVKVGAANAVGTSHSLARADHVHEREHAIYTDAAAKAAAVQAGAITNAVTKAPTHDAVFDVKATADAAQPAATDAAAAVTAMGVLGDGNALNHDKYTDAEAKAAAVQAGAITNAVTKAPTHDAVFDVKATADAALPAANKYTDAEAKTQAEAARLDDHAAPEDNTDLDAAAGQHGLMPKLDKVKLDAAVTTATATTLVIRDASARTKFAAPGAAGDALIKGTRVTVAELPALTDEKIWKGTGGNVEEVDVYTDAKAVDAIEADGNLPVASITFIIDGATAEITTGIKGALEIPFACTINRVTLLADQSGSIVIDIWKQAYADYPPENANSIVAAAPPTLSSADHSQDSTLTDWTTAIAAGDCLMFNVDSIATCTWVTLSLKVTKT